MTLGRDDLIGVASAERQRLGRMIQFADAASWEKPSAAQGWWNRDVMAHLAAHDTAAAQLLAEQPAEELEAFEATLGDAPFAVDAFNAWTVDRRSGLDTREVLNTWGRAADSFLAHAAALTDQAWRDRRFPWLAGDIAARYLIQSRVVEWFLHGEDIRATNGVATGWQPLWQHWPVHLTIDLGVRMLPWSLSQAGYDLPRRSVRLDLEGTGGGSWHWGLATGEVPAPDRTADAMIVGRAPQFSLVAGRRLSADEALDAGTVVLGGDVALADVIMRTIRAYP